jgi:hypothetical protein
MKRAFDRFGLQKIGYVNNKELTRLIIFIILNLYL